MGSLAPHPFRPITSRTTGGGFVVVVVGGGGAVVDTAVGLGVTVVCAMVVGAAPSGKASPKRCQTAHPPRPAAPPNIHRNLRRVIGSIRPLPYR